MQRDIRDLFDDSDFSSKKLPKNHRSEFIERLRKTKQHKKASFRLLSAVAASLAILISVSYFVSTFSQKAVTDHNLTDLELQVQQIEKKYLLQIDTEWADFIKATDDQKLINKYRDKLDALDSNYKELSVNFKEDPNNIIILEELINNLQTRLQFLKDIQEHIKILNNKNSTNETLVL